MKRDKSYCKVVEETCGDCSWRRFEEERCCGNCCWFYGEMTDGEGICAVCDILENGVCCSDGCKTDGFVSRQEMRHHMAVLLQDIRWDEDQDFIHYAPDGDEATKAKKFAYKYMKTFSEL